jgi:UDP-GlcNAc:undecaprenyl-phosphate/decaprenyl-phosphate GlcNAc-1-phosphate transferase
MMIPFIGAFLTAIFVVFFSTKKIIHIAHKKNLFDEPLEKRKIHLIQTPNLGGISIFASLVFTCVIFIEGPITTKLRYTIVALLLLFFIGVIDDLVGLDPLKKLVGQLIVALLAAIPGGIHFSGFYGLFGFYELPYYINIITSVAFILLMINAFNLIDGINCLAGGIGLFICLAFSVYFGSVHANWLFTIAVTMSGSLIGFLWYNRTPARIFMGDSGSLILGLVISLLTINFTELNLAQATYSPTYIRSGPAVVLSLLIVPIFDTIRIFTTRILNKKSPFLADRNHIHHLLIDLGFSHLQATAILISITAACFLFISLFNNWGNEILISILVAISIILNKFLSFAAKKQLATQKIPLVNIPIEAEFKTTLKVLNRSKKVAVIAGED